MILIESLVNRIGLGKPRASGDDPDAVGEVDVVRLSKPRASGDDPEITPLGELTVQ